MGHEGEESVPFIDFHRPPLLNKTTVYLWNFDRWSSLGPRVREASLGSHYSVSGHFRGHNNLGGQKKVERSLALEWNLSFFLIEGVQQ